MLFPKKALRTYLPVVAAVGIMSGGAAAAQAQAPDGTPPTVATSVGDHTATLDRAGVDGGAHVEIVDPGTGVSTSAGAATSSTEVGDTVSLDRPDAAEGDSSDETSVSVGEGTQSIETPVAER